MILLQRDKGCWSGNTVGSCRFSKRNALFQQDLRPPALSYDYRSSLRTQTSKGLQLVCQMSEQHGCLCVHLKQSPRLSQIVNPILNTHMHMKTHSHTYAQRRICRHLQTFVHSGSSIPPVRLVNLSKCHITEAATCAFPQQPVR